MILTKLGRALAGLLVTATMSAPAPAAGQSELVYVSNVTGTTEGTRALTTIEDQTRRTLDRLGEELRDRGLGYGDVVAVNVFLTDARNFQAMNGIYRTYFQTDPPTRATVEADLPDPAALVQVSAVAGRGGGSVVKPRLMRSPELPYSWGKKVGNTLFVAGATSRDPDTYQPVTGDVATQTRRILGNIGMVLDEAGMDFGDVTACRVFLEDARTFGEMNRAYAEVMPATDPPTRATVRAGLMNPAFSAEVQCVAEESPARRVVIREGGDRGGLPFSPGISTGESLYLSGMVGSGPEGVPPDVEGQTRNTLHNLAATLAAAGMDFTDVVDWWVYVTDIRDWDAVKAVLDEVMPEGAPTPTVVGTPLMGPRLLVEIQMTAER